MIRPFSLSDLDHILQIERHSFPKSPYSWITFIDLHDLFPETFLVYLDAPEDQEGGQIMGYIVFAQDGHIISIAVHPQKRRKGIGNELLKRVLTFPHVKKIWAEVRKSNHGAQAFYLQMGFQITGVIPNYYGDEDAMIVQWTSPSKSH